MVKKAFRKLEKLHKESQISPGAEEIDRMVQLILNQDHAIREQIQRMRDLDQEIEQVEMHVQREPECEFPACGQSLDVHNAEQLQEYLFTSDGVEHLELQVQRHQELILQLCQDIDAELTKTANATPSAEDGEPEGAVAASWIPSGSDESFYAAELERLQTELERSLFTGVSLHQQAAEIDKWLKCYDATLVSKDQECWQLAAQLSSLQIGADAGAEEKSTPAGVKCDTQTVKLKHSLSPVDITDTDSDTGISSTHSQDSLSPALDCPPPLDTDV
ncbi:unnamed protein product [Lampetra planeri]